MCGGLIQFLESGQLLFFCNPVNQHTSINPPTHPHPQTLVMRVFSCRIVSISASFSSSWPFSCVHSCS
jgi:hypothetical protein